MVLGEQKHSKQVSTTLTEEQFSRWQQLCQKEGKSSFMLLREIVLMVVNNETTPEKSD